MTLLIIGLAMGIGGTIAMDIWAIVLARFFGQSAPNWAMPGRWLAHAMAGRLWHDDIGAAIAVKNELALGWVFHYGVGAAYGAFFAVLAGPLWLVAPTLLPVWGFSLLTIFAGWCLLQPGMGLGWFASKTPHPWKVRALGVLAHTWFALGMWAVAVALAA